MTMSCADILHQGIFDVVRFVNYKSIESHYYDWLMNVTESEARKATDLGLDMTIDVDGAPVPLKSNFTHDDWSNWSKKREHLQKIDITKVSIIKSFSRTVDQGLVSAWSKCMSEYFSSSGKEHGLLLDVSNQDGDVIPVQVRLAIDGPPVHAKVESWDVSNCKVQAGKIPNALVSNTPVQVIYHRIDPNEEVVISIQTSRGTLLGIIRPDIPISPLKRRLGKDFGAVTVTGPVTVTVEMDQEIRVWGGVVAQYERSGNPSATAWLYKDKAGGAIEWRSPADVQMQLNPDGSQPYASVFGMPFRGTVVGEFDFKVHLQTGESYTCVGYTENQHAKAADFVIFIDYLEMPDPAKVKSFAASGIPVPV